MLIDEKAFEKTWEENKLPILTNKMQFRRHIEAYEAAKSTDQPDDCRSALHKIAEAAVSSSPDAHYLGNVARKALGMEPLPKKDKMP